MIHQACETDWTWATTIRHSAQVNVLDRQQLSEVLTRTADLGLRALTEAIGASDRETVAAGILGYPARISKTASLIDGALNTFASFALEKARLLDGDFEAFEYVRQQTDQFCSTIQADLPLMLVLIGDSATAGREFPWGVSARLIGRLRGDLDMSFLNAAHNFRRAPLTHSSAVDAVAETHHPAGNVTMPHNHIGLGFAHLELRKAILKARGRDSYGVYLDDARLRKQTESDRWSALRDAEHTSIDALVKSLTHRINVPPLEIWTRERPHLAPEQIDHHRLALSHSLNWVMTLATGHLAVGADALAPINGWPLFMGKGPWLTYLTTILAMIARPTSQKNPPVPDRELEEWWKSKKESRDGISQLDLLKLAKAAFPKHYVTRERVRKLSEGRKVGRKKK